MFLKLKNNIVAVFTFCALFLLPVSTAVMVNHALTNQTIVDMERGFFGKNTCSVVIQNEDFTLKDFSKFLNDDMAVYYDYDETVREIIYTNKYAYFPMLSGRFFSEDDFNVSEKYAVVGKAHINDIFNINNKSYIKIEGIDYEVIGVFGTDIDTMFDNKILVNNPIEKRGKSDLFYIDCFFDDSDSVVSSIIKDLESAGIIAKQISTEKSLLSDIIPNILFSRWFLLLIACDLVCVILLSIEWIHSKKKEIAVKLLLGNSNLTIIISTCLSYILTVVFAFAGGLLLSCLLYPQHIQYIWQSVAVIIPLALIILIIAYVCIKKVPIEEAIK